MSAVSETIGSLQHAVHERLTSPLLGAFAFSWLVFNWDGLFYLFFEQEVDVTTRLIAYGTLYTDIWDLLYYPFFLTVAFILVYPPLGGLAFLFWKWIESIKVDKSGEITKNYMVDGALFLEVKERLRSFEVKKEEELELIVSEKATLESEASKLRSELGAKLAEITVMQDEHSSDRKDWKTKLESKIADNEKQAKDLQEFRTKNLVLEEAIHDTKSQYNGLKEKLASKEALLDSVEKKFADQLMHIQELQHKSSSLETKARAAIEDAEDNALKLEQYRESINSLRSAWNRLKASRVLVENEKASVLQGLDVPSSNEIELKGAQRDFEEGMKAILENWKKT